MQKVFISVLLLSTLSPAMAQKVEVHGQQIQLLAPFVGETFRPSRIKQAKGLPASIDLRSAMPPIRNQGRRGTCVIFALAAAIEFDLGPNIDLSEQYMWWSIRSIASSKGAYPAQSAAWFNTNPIPEEQYWPYNPQKTCEDYDYTCSETYHQGDPVAGRPESLARENAIFAARKFRTSYRWSLKSLLAQGKPVTISLNVGDYFMFIKKGEIIKKLHRNKKKIYGGHAVTVVGYEDDPSIPGGGFFIIRNSWGTKWGDNGYARLSYDYPIRNRLIYLTGTHQYSK